MSHFPEPGSEESSTGGEPVSVGLETAVVITVDAPELEAIYHDSYPAFAELGIPLHVTLLYPFAPPERLESVLPLLRTVVSRHESFRYELTELRTFPRAIWIAPEPAGPFVALTEAIEAAFPDYPLWGGAFETVIPHATLMDGIEEGRLEPTLARLRPVVDPLLPIELSVYHATVLVEEPSGQWVSWARLSLGNAS